MNKFDFVTFYICFMVCVGITTVVFSPDSYTIETAPGLEEAIEVPSSTQSDNWWDGIIDFFKGTWDNLAMIGSFFANMLTFNIPYTPIEIRLIMMTILHSIGVYCIIEVVRGV